MYENHSLQHFQPRRIRKCGNLCTVCMGTLAFITLMTLLAIFAVDVSQKIHVVYIKGLASNFTTDEKFLSIALDSSIIASGFKNFNMTDPKILKIMGALAPAYLRVGGTMADRLTFSTSKSFHFKHLAGNLDGGVCANEENFCDYLQKPNFTMNGEEWLRLNELAQNTGLDIIFDLNALKRFENGSWDYNNAEKLIHFSDGHNLDVNWELGNEPNSFRHQFNYEVQPEQMAQDFQTLRDILNRYPKYMNSILVGPDVTRPEANRNASQIYLRQFLGGAAHVIDAVTWHQYYFNGAIAKVADFLNPANFDVLQWQINVVKDIVKARGVDIPIWLGETSSAYGGGAPHLSDRYIATFLWLDKLGTAAKNGLSVVIRQSIFQGHYALINNHYYPTPDWWVSVLHKRLVGNKIVDCRLTTNEKLRLYCQCTKTEAHYGSVPSVTVFGVNLNHHKVRIRFEGMWPFTDENSMKDFKVQAYVLTTVDRIDSRFIYLNDELLLLTETNDVPDLIPETVAADPYVEMPPYSLAFWVVPITNNVLPYC